MKKNMIRLFGLFCVIPFGLGCGILVNDNNVINAVKKQGYRNIEIVNKHIFFVNWRGCSKEDEACYDLIATNSNGERVNILACAGWPFKGVTVRTE